MKIAYNNLPSPLWPCPVQFFLKEVLPILRNLDPHNKRPESECAHIRSFHFPYSLEVILRHIALRKFMYRGKEESNGVVAS